MRYRATTRRSGGEERRLRASNTTASRHCRKRLDTVDQAPNSCGISRHRLPASHAAIADVGLPAVADDNYTWIV
ncbi:hypothetical protein GCM10027187_65050 [Streptosporangium sandarakinum]